MQGYPKRLGSRQDVLNLRRLPECREQLKSDLERLLAGRFAWVAGEELAAVEAGLEDDTHKVVTEEHDGQLVRRQMEMVEDPRAEIFRLGLTVAEVQDFLADLEQEG